MCEVTCFRLKDLRLFLQQGTPLRRGYKKFDGSRYPLFRSCLTLHSLPRCCPCIPLFFLLCIAAWLLFHYVNKNLRASPLNLIANTRRCREIEREASSTAYTVRYLSPKPIPRAPVEPTPFPFYFFGLQ